MRAVVSPGPPRRFNVIARKDQRSLHRLVGLPPIAGVDIQITRAVLQEDADRFRFLFSDQDVIPVGSPQTGIRTDGTEHPRELFRSFPGGRKSADRATASPADGTVVSFIGKIDGSAVRCLLALDKRENFFQQEPCIAISQAVVFEAAVKPVQCIGALSQYFPGVIKTPMVTGISPLAIRLSKTVGAFHCTPSWLTYTHAGLSALYCAGI